LKTDKTHNQDDRLRIAISVCGGVGDILTFGLAVKELSKHIGCDHSIDMSVMNPKQALDLRSIFREFPFISFLQNIESSETCSDELPYDVFLRIDRCTIPFYCNDRVKSKSPWLAKFCAQSKTFCTRYHKFFENVPRNHIILEQWSIVNDMTRVQQPDQCKFLGIDYNTSTFLAVDSNALNVLESLNLANSRYITLQTGIHQYWGTLHSTKIWLPRHYVKFVQLFHEAYPDIKIVQLGSSKSLCTSISGIDLNLVGKTTLDEVAAILKHSLFHLDGDCGMVHIKKFLNGQSIVLFGTTSADLLGYPENINITGSGCKSWCEWVTDDWYRKCPRGFEETPCMASITPEIVMEAVHKIIDNLKVCTPTRPSTATFRKKQLMIL
jgi:ADP-heptose:LPS heptosyltransferase